MYLLDTHAFYWYVTGDSKLPVPIETFMQDCSDYAISILQIKASHLARLQELPWIHRDPFDRLMICQAKEENLAFITADENIARYDIKTIWNT